MEPDDDLAEDVGITNDPGLTRVTSCLTSGGSSRRRAVARISSSTCDDCGCCDSGGDGEPDLRSMVEGGLGVLESGKLATSLLTLSDRMEPKVWSGDTRAPAEATRPLTEPSVTRKGSGVGQGDGGAEDTLDRELDTVECGHFGVVVSTSVLDERPHHRHSQLLACVRRCGP